MPVKTMEELMVWSEDESDSFNGSEELLLDDVVDSVQF